MRFRYIDGRGKEITLDSVEALAARIELGAVTASTELYDARTDTWGPAEAQAVYNQVLEEAAARDFGASITPAPGPRAATGPQPATPSAATTAPVAGAEPRRDSAPPVESGAVLETVGELLEADPLAAAEPLAAMPPAVSEPFDIPLAASEPFDIPLAAPAPLAEPGGLAETPAESDEHDLGVIGSLELERSAITTGLTSAALDREPPLEGFSATPPQDWAEEAQPESTHQPREEDGAPDGLVIDHEWGSGSFQGDDSPGPEPAEVRPPREAAGVPERRAHPFDATDPFESADPFEPPDPFAGDAGGDGGWPDVAFEDDIEEPGLLPRALSLLTTPQVQWCFLLGSFLIMALFGSAVASGLLLRALLTVSVVLSLGLLTGLILWRDPERRSLIPAATFGLVTVLSVPLFSVGARADAAEPAPSARTAARNSERTAVGSVPEANPGEAAMEDRALEEVVAGMDSLAISYGLDRRPAEWLQGIYLANASQFPGVQAYWQRYQRYLNEIETQDADWFRASYEARLREAGIEEAAVGGLVERGMSRFYASAGRRQELYDTMRDLADGGLELHALLLDREQDIDYEPFSQNGVSADPVVEAVPNDPLLEDQMWAIIGRLALALERITELGQTSPGHLQQALADSIKASIR